MLAKRSLDRRTFLKTGIAAGSLAGALPSLLPSNPAVEDAKVAIVSCKTYGPAVVEEAMSKSFDLLGGIGQLVKNKTVTVKVNLTRTGNGFVVIQGRPPGETYVTHGDTIHALCSQLFKAGARRVRIVESFPDARPFEECLSEAGWDVAALRGLGAVEIENTRNLGTGTRYSTTKVPFGGYLFSSFELNHSYSETDVFVSLSKLKNHSVAGVTMSLKNLFGLTPNSLYGDQAPSEAATAGRGKLHFGTRFARDAFPGQKEGQSTSDAGYRIPRIVVDLCAARPVHLTVVDGITSVSRGEGPWIGKLGLTRPGILLAGLNPVATDAVGTAVMGYDPRGSRGDAPFLKGDNHLLLAEQAGLGTADLSRIEVRGLNIADAKYPYG